LLSFGAESFVVEVAIQIYLKRIRYTELSCCLLFYMDKKPFALTEGGT
jgi:hypothetical protein